MGPRPVAGIGTAAARDSPAPKKSPTQFTSPSVSACPRQPRFRRRILAQIDEIGVSAQLRALIKVQKFHFFDQKVVSPPSTHQTRAETLDGIPKLGYRFLAPYPRYSTVAYTLISTRYAPCGWPTAPKVVETKSPDSFGHPPAPPGPPSPPLDRLTRWVQWSPQPLFAPTQVHHLGDGVCVGADLTRFAALT